MPIFKSPENLSAVESIRKRPGMYVGSVDFFGFVHYLVCPFSLLLSRRPSWIDVTATASGFVLESDALLVLEAKDDDKIFPFDSFDGPNFGGQGFEGQVLNALSETLEVRASASGTARELSYCKGQRISSIASPSDETGTRLSFAPDTSILTVTEISPMVFESYLRRMSFLHRGVRFRLTVGEQTQEFFSSRGIRDLFDSISSPYQLLHEPVHITAEEGELRLELVFAHQSWTDDLTWCFINNGRAVQGGTHEDGLRQGLRKLRTKLKLPKHFSNGVVAVMSIIYPNTVWQGCIKAKVGNPELKEMVSRLVVEQTMEWFKTNPEVLEQVKQLRTFSFPDAWYS